MILECCNEKPYGPPGIDLDKGWLNIVDPANSQFGMEVSVVSILTAKLKISEWWNKSIGAVCKYSYYTQCILVPKCSVCISDSGREGYFLSLSELGHVFGANDTIQETKYGNLYF